MCSSRTATPSVKYGYVSDVPTVGVYGCMFVSIVVYPEPFSEDIVYVVRLLISGSRTSVYVLDSYEP